MRKGFTLLELLIVMVIIAVLAAVAFPQFMGSIKKSREAKAVSDLSAIRTYEQAIYANTGEWGDLPGSGTAKITAGIDLDTGSTANEKDWDIRIAIDGETFYTYAVDKVAGTATAKTTGTGGQRTVTINLSTGVLTYAP